MTPEQSTVQYYANRSLAFQAAVEIIMKHLAEMQQVLTAVLDAAKEYDSQFNVPVSDPSKVLVSRLREKFPVLEGKTDQEIMQLLASNPSYLNG